MPHSNGREKFLEFFISEQFAFYSGSTCLTSTCLLIKLNGGHLFYFLGFTFMLKSMREVIRSIDHFMDLLMAFISQVMIVNFY